MKSWKKQLNSEFEKAVPALKEEVKNAPIANAESYETESRGGVATLKRKVGIGSAFTLVVIAFVLAVLGFAGVFNKGMTGNSGGNIFVLEINPSVAFITDEKGNVKSVKSLNEDADVLLSGENVLSLITDKPLDESIVNYTDTAVKTGYIDLSSHKNAVRLSTTEEADGKLFSSASSSLKNYFKEKGIYSVIVENVFSVNELCTFLEIEITDKLADVTDYLENLSDRFSERVDENATEDILQNLYDQYVMGIKTYELVRDELLDNLDKITDNAKSLNDMVSLNYGIMISKDNPCFPFDFWLVEKYAESDFTQEFSLMMSEMEKSLTEYEKKFGTKIESLSELKSLADVYSSFSDYDFEEEFSNLTWLEFKLSSDKYLSVLENIGFDVENIESAPSTIAEYLQQIKSLAEKHFRSKIEKYKAVYEEVRVKISETDYEDFVNGIIEEFGSLENFWNKK